MPPAADIEGRRPEAQRRDQPRAGRPTQGRVGNRKGRGAREASGALEPVSGRAAERAERSRSETGGRGCGPPSGGGAEQSEATGSEQGNTKENREACRKASRADAQGKRALKRESPGVT